MTSAIFVAGLSAFLISHRRELLWIFNKYRSFAELWVIARLDMQTAASPITHWNAYRRSNGIDGGGTVDFGCCSHRCTFNRLLILQTAPEARITKHLSGARHASCRYPHMFDRTINGIEHFRSIAVNFRFSEPICTYIQVLSDFEEE